MGKMMINKVSMMNAKLMNRAVKIASLAVLSVSVIGCQKKNDEGMKSQNLADVYGRNAALGYQEAIHTMSETFQQKGGFSTMPNYSPVMTAPKTASVWIPTVRNKRDDALSPGHITFIKVYDSEWAYDISDDHDPLKFANLRMVEVPEAENEGQVSWREAQDRRSRDAEDGNGVFTVPVVIEKKN
jgi:hypothetical protein